MERPSRPSQLNNGTPRTTSANAATRHSTVRSELLNMARNSLLNELRDMELISHMYLRQNKTQAEIADILEYSKSTICRKMDKYGIESSYNGSAHPSFGWSDGYRTAQARTADGRKTFYIHRLTAFAHFDGELSDFPDQVHHRNKCKVDNSERNLEPLCGRQHQAVHHMDEWVEHGGWPVLLSPKYGVDT